MSIDEQWDQSEQSGLVGKIAAGRYSILSQLRADERQTLYEAEDVEHGTRVSLEVLHAATATNNSAKLRSLTHPNLAVVLDVGKLDSGEPFFTTELVHGKSLRATMNARHVEPGRALSIVRQVLQALAAAHDAGVLHGDVRPENITITADARGVEQVKLLDLGAAMLSGGGRIGDPRYRAPECESGFCDARADLYSVGAVLYELLTDRPPFIADDASALTRMHAYAPVQTLQRRAPERSYSSELEQLVACALAKQPDERFRSAADMIIALDAAMKLIEAAPPAIVARPTQPPVDNSLALFAEGLVPAAAPQRDPVIPLNTSRQVRELPWSTRALKLVRRLVDPVRAWLRKLDRTHRLIVVALGGALVVAFVIGIVVRARGGTSATAAGIVAHDSDLAARARSLLDAGDAKHATELIKRELAGHPDDGAAYLVLGHAQVALGRFGDGLAAYGHAIRLLPALANDPELIASVEQILTSRDPPTSISALELLSSSTSSAAQDAIVAQASNTTSSVRHRAFAIAEREGIADRIDRVSSWTLDLQQATTCAERKTTIAKLADTGDRRALPALRQSRTHKCVTRDATAAIQKINAAATH